MISDTQKQQLVYLAVSTQVRAHGDRRWDEAGLSAEVSRLAESGVSAQEVIDRTLQHAWDPKSKTPASLRWPARGHGAPQEPVKPLPRDAECSLHPGKPAMSCSACAADAIASDPQRAGKRPIYAEDGQKLKHRPLRELVAEALAEPKETA